MLWYAVKEGVTCEVVAVQRLQTLVHLGAADTRVRLMYGKPIRVRAKRGKQEQKEQKHR
jgi:hypothetical protein